MKNFLVSILSVGLVAGVSVSAMAGGSSSVGPANPASLLCHDLGGKYAPAYDLAGEGGLCQFGRGLIEEWTLWRFKNGDSAEAAKVFLAGKSVKEMKTEFSGQPGIQPMMPNPASVNCANVGGEVKIVRDQNGGEFGLCRFSDGSLIEEWTLFRGAKDPFNKKLVRALLK